MIGNVTFEADALKYDVLSRAKQHVPYGKLVGIAHLKRDGTRAETRFRLSP